MIVGKVDDHPIHTAAKAEYICIWNAKVEIIALKDN
jgi:hypothetical protein